MAKPFAGEDNLFADDCILFYLCFYVCLDERWHLGEKVQEARCP